MSLKHQDLPLGKDRPAPEATIWATSTDLAGSEFERKTYFIKLKDGDKETKFIDIFSKFGRVVRAIDTPPVRHTTRELWSSEVNA